MPGLFQNLFAPPRDLFLIILAIWIGLAIMERRAPDPAVDLNAVNNLLLVAWVAFVVGGRLFYVVENLSIFAQSPSSVVSLDVNLFDPSGGLALCLVAAFAYGQRAHLPFWPTLDTLAPFLAVLAV